MIELFKSFSKNAVIAPLSWMMHVLYYDVTGAEYKRSIEKNNVCIIYDEQNGSFE